jgi:putative flippase GtrA
LVIAQIAGAIAALFAQFIPFDGWTFDALELHHFVAKIGL